MYLESKEIIDRPLDQVYKLVRDELPKLVPYMPNIERIEVKKHAPMGDGKIEVINHWYAVAEIPALAKKFISPEIFSWKDMAKWNDQEHAVEYVMESFLANDLFEAKGKNFFTAVGDKTELKVTCNIKIYADRVPGVPRLLAGKVLPLVEGLIERMLKPNLASLGKGLNQYFKDNS
jgi:hypothetical protein